MPAVVRVPPNPLTGRAAPSGSPSISYGNVGRLALRAQAIQQVQPPEPIPQQPAPLPAPSQDVTGLQGDKVTSYNPNEFSDIKTLTFNTSSTAMGGTQAWATNKNMTLTDLQKAGYQQIAYKEYNNKNVIVGNPDQPGEPAPYQVQQFYVFAKPTNQAQATYNAQLGVYNQANLVASVTPPQPLSSSGVPLEKTGEIITQGKGYYNVTPVYAPEPKPNIQTQAQQDQRSNFVQQSFANKNDVLATLALVVSPTSLATTYTGTNAKNSLTFTDTPGTGYTYAVSDIVSSLRSSGYTVTQNKDGTYTATKDVVYTTSKGLPISAGLAQKINYPNLSVNDYITQLKSDGVVLISTGASANLPNQVLDSVNVRTTYSSLGSKTGTTTGNITSLFGTTSPTQYISLSPSDAVKYGILTPDQANGVSSVLVDSYRVLVKDITYNGQPYPGTWILYDVMTSSANIGNPAVAGLATLFNSPSYIAAQSNANNPLAMALNIASLVTGNIPLFINSVLSNTFGSKASPTTPKLTPMQQVALIEAQSLRSISPATFPLYTGKTGELGIPNQLQALKSAMSTETGAFALSYLGGSALGTIAGATTNVLGNIGGKLFGSTGTTAFKAIPTAAFIGAGGYQAYQTVPALYTQYKTELQQGYSPNIVGAEITSQVANIIAFGKGFNVGYEPFKPTTYTVQSIESKYGTSATGYVESKTLPKGMAEMDTTQIVRAIIKSSKGAIDNVIQKFNINQLMKTQELYSQSRDAIITIGDRSISGKITLTKVVGTGEAQAISTGAQYSNAEVARLFSKTTLPREYAFQGSTIQATFNTAEKLSQEELESVAQKLVSKGFSKVTSREIVSTRINPETGVAVVTVKTPIVTNDLNFLIGRYFPQLKDVIQIGSEVKPKLPFLKSTPELQQGKPVHVSGISKYVGMLKGESGKGVYKGVIGELAKAEENVGETLKAEKTTTGKTTEQGEITKATSGTTDAVAKLSIDIAKNVKEQIETSIKETFKPKNEYLQPLTRLSSATGLALSSKAVSAVSGVRQIQQPKQLEQPATVISNALESVLANVQANLQTQQQSQAQIQTTQQQTALQTTQTTTPITPPYTPTTTIPNPVISTGYPIFPFIPTTGGGGFGVNAAINTALKVIEHNIPDVDVLLGGFLKSTPSVSRGNLGRIAPSMFSQELQTNVPLEEQVAAKTRIRLDKSGKNYPSQQTHMLASAQNINQKISQQSDYSVGSIMQAVIPLTRSILQQTDSIPKFSGTAIINAGSPQRVSPRSSSTSARPTRISPTSRNYISQVDALTQQALSLRAPQFSTKSTYRMPPTRTEEGGQASKKKRAPPKASANIVAQAMKRTNSILANAMRVM